MKTISEIAEFLKLQRVQRNLKLDQMVERTGLTAVTLRGLLNGKNDSRLSTVLAVAHELGLELALVPAGMAKSVQHSEPRPAIESLVSKALRSQKSTVATPRDRALTPSEADDDRNERGYGFASAKFDGGHK